MTAAPSDREAPETAGPFRGLRQNEPDRRRPRPDRGEGEEHRRTIRLCRTFAVLTSEREDGWNCRVLHQHRPRTSWHRAHHHNDRCSAQTRTPGLIRPADRPCSVLNKADPCPREFRCVDNRLDQTAPLPAQRAKRAVRLWTASDIPSLPNNLCEWRKRLTVR